MLFQVWMRWRYHNAKDKEENTSVDIPAKLTVRKGKVKRRFAREASDYAVLNLKNFREVELKRVRPFAVISMRVREATRDTDGTVLWSKFSNDQTITTLEGGNTKETDAGCFIAGSVNTCFLV